MEWWLWLVVAVVVVVVLFAVFAGVQAKRRSGGVKTTKRGRS